MKTLYIETTAKEVEVVNFLLSEAIKSLNEKPTIRESFKLTEDDLYKAEKFRRKLISSDI